MLQLEASTLGTPRRGQHHCLTFARAPLLPRNQHRRRYGD
jgi:hypothetical protein